MKTTFVVVVAITVTLAGSALADSYVIENQITHKCSIVSQNDKPMPNMNERIVRYGLYYPTRSRNCDEDREGLRQHADRFEYHTCQPGQWYCTTSLVPTHGRSQPVGRGVALVPEALQALSSA
jgi:hypothetical protein